MFRRINSAIFEKLRIGFLFILPHILLQKKIFISSAATPMIRRRENDKYLLYTYVFCATFYFNHWQFNIFQKLLRNIVSQHNRMYSLERFTIIFKHTNAHAYTMSITITYMLCIIDHYRVLKSVLFSTIKLSHIDF